MYVCVHIHTCVHRELLVGVSTSSPGVPGPSAKHQLTKAEAVLDVRAAEKACQREQANYTDLCSQAGLQFLPATFESSGRVHSPLESYFTTGMSIMKQYRSFTRVSSYDGLVC